MSHLVILWVPRVGLSWLPVLDLYIEAARLVSVIFLVCRLCVCVTFFFFVCLFLLCVCVRCGFAASLVR